MRTTTDVVFQISLLLNEQSLFVETGKVIGLAEAYNRACSSAIDRAHQCMELIEKGARREALELAQQAPDLQEELTVLDFEGRAEWLGLCNSVGVTTVDGAAVGVPLDDVKGVVETLYQESRPLKRLLRVHQRLALGLAPLRERLKVLRRIWQEDAGNSFWEEDLRTYEKARAEELAREALAADRAGEMQTLEAILAEFQSSEWHEPPDPGFISGAKQLLKPHRERYARTRYTELAEKIRRAHSAWNEAECRALLGEWRGVREVTEVDPNPEEAEAVAPIEGWLKELDATRAEEAAFQAMCRSLENALDEKQKKHSLEKLAADVLRYERGMPELLGARLASQLEELKRQGHRRFVLTMTGTVMGLVLVGAALTWMFLWQAKRSEVSWWVKQVTAAIEKGDLDTAGKLLARCEQDHKQVYASPELQALNSDYLQKVKAEGIRKQDFQEALAAVEKAGLDLPDREALKRAQGLARLPEEKSLVEQWNRKITRHANEQWDEQEHVLESKLQELDKIAEIGAKDIDIDEAEAKRVGDESILLSQRLAAADGISEAQKSQALTLEQAVESRVKSIQDQVERRKVVRIAITELPGYYNRPDLLAQRLKQFTARFEKDPLAAEFLRAEEMAPAWTAMENWRKLCGAWGTGAVKDRATAEMRGKSLEQCLEEGGGTQHPCLESLMGYQKYLATAQAVLTTDGLKGLKAFRGTVNDTLIADVQVIFTNDGRKFYLRSGPNDKPWPQTISQEKTVVEYRFRYIMDGSLQTRSGSLKVGELKNPDAPDLREEAPQNRFSKAARKRIQEFDEVKGEGWESFYLGLAELVQKEPEIDPILRMRLLQTLLLSASECTPVKKKEVGDLLAPLRELDVTDVAWMDPYDPSANDMRPKATRALEDASPARLKALGEDVRAEVTKLIRPTKVPRPVGMLMGAKGEVRLGEKVAQGALYVLWSEKGERATFHKIGQVEKETVIPDKEKAALYPRGTPVYVGEP